ncbi:DUF1697 domain-containing protein [Thiothrix litoralis]|uniref:DUF1697 domain-containing protein n=1 Tax=Thiothrix litoralis TaxID=2891210 RepID=A0ABX7WR29_9GAMM|nr:DUF1697 domain-containing protein [Thiothrix litoralis]QTR44808.1 DUF1697 domain-containing protein [Thiothrix litoralis]
MNTYIALFRGINVGGNNILPMKELTNLLQQSACKNVQTYIQSGNVVLQAEQSRDELAEAISAKIAEARGFNPKVLLLEVMELEAAAANNPFPTEDGKALHLFFMETIPPSPDLEKLTALKSTSEDFRLYQNVFYLYAPDGIGRSKLAAKVESILGVPTTARNWNTVSKLLAMVKLLPSE